MRAGEFPDGSKTLRAKIDMAAGNINLRDPVMYRIRKATHHRTGDTWCIYPMYDWAHGQSDSIEGVTHSLCTLEYEDHRPLYDWYLDALGIYHPRQIEFARLNLSHTVMSKRKLLTLVEDGLVSGWDDPRMPTLAGLRRRGYTPASHPRLRRPHRRRQGRQPGGDGAPRTLHARGSQPDAPQRRLAVLRPLRLVIENYPEGQVEEVEAVNNPEDPAAGTRTVPFSRVLYIEQDDFRETPPPKYFRLSPGAEVRLRYAYIVKCTGFTRAPDGVDRRGALHVRSRTRAAGTPKGRKVKGTIHWVSAPHAIDAEVRLYDTLFTVPKPDETEDFKSALNPNSLEVLRGAEVEPALRDGPAGVALPVRAPGLFRRRLEGPAPGRLVFNRTVGLRDTWAKIEKAG